MFSGVTRMRRSLVFFLFAVLILGAAAVGDNATRAAVLSRPQAQPAPPTIASALDREIGAVEKEVVEAAEAMPEDKFNFSPETLNIPGSIYKGVRTFGAQVKHIAT